MADHSQSPSRQSKSPPPPTKNRGRPKSKSHSSRERSSNKPSSSAAAEKDAKRRHLALSKQFDKAQKKAATTSDVTASNPGGRPNLAPDQGLSPQTCQDHSTWSTSSNADQQDNQAVIWEMFAQGSDPITTLQAVKAFCIIYTYCSGAPPSRVSHLCHAARNL